MEFYRRLKFPSKILLVGKMPPVKFYVGGKCSLYYFGVNGNRPESTVTITYVSGVLGMFQCVCVCGGEGGVKKLLQSHRSHVPCYNNIFV